MKILLTGGSGFVGSALLKCLVTEQHRVVAVTRSINDYDASIEQVNIPSIDKNTDYHSKLIGCEVVIHCAARAHIMNDELPDPLVAYREVNTDGTLNLAQQAADAGVKRFIFISSIKVNGESTTGSAIFSEPVTFLPVDPYGLSKYEAEIGLRKMSLETTMEVVIIRPSLVYGPGVKGNFLNLLKLSRLPIPLPFGLINNKRSMVYLDNLVDLIIACIDHPKAANRVFLASDGDDLSLLRLLTLIRKAMNKPSLLLPIPSFLFNLLGKLSGKPELVDRLIGNLQVDSSDANKYLGWTAPYSVGQGIKVTVDDFLKNN